MRFNTILKLSCTFFVCKGCFRFVVQWLFFGLQLQRGSENTGKTRGSSKEEIKKQLIDSIINNEIIETEELNDKPDKAEKPKDAVDIVKQYEDIIYTKKKNIISIVYHQGKIFLKDLRTRKSLLN